MSADHLDTSTPEAEVQALNRQMDGERREARWADLESSERTYANTKHVLAQLDALEAGDSDEVALSGDPRALVGILTFLLDCTGSEIDRATAETGEDDREGYFARIGRLTDLLTWATEQLAWLEAEEARVERAGREAVAA